MKKLLLGLVLATGAFATPAFADYSAVSIGGNGWGFASGYPSMEAARAEAVRLCRSYGGSCSASTAENDYWYFSAGYCNNMPYTAASPQGWWRSEQLVFAKGAADGNYDCKIEIDRP